MYKLKKIIKVFTSKFVGNGTSSYEKRIYRAAVSQRLRNTGLDDYSACRVWQLIVSCLNAHSRTYVEHNINNHITQI